jgi:hypothetical protein
MKKAILMTTLLAVGSLVSTANAGGPISLTVRMGYSIGATSPLSMPASVTGIDAFRPTPSVLAGLDASFALSSRWSVAAGLRIENKAMDADITTKGYHMELRKGADQIEGLFTGHVSQQATQWMLTLPVYATLHLGPHWQVNAGPYLSLLIGKSFSGTASDGYLRQGGPTGPRINIGDTPDTWATYDFSDNMRSLQAGIMLGADWQPLPRIGFSFGLSMGLTGIFPSNFATVEQTLYPIYGNLGVFYRIN